MRSRFVAALAAAAVVVVLSPAIVAAHSELEASVPADGAVLTEPPIEIVGDFSEELDPARSSMELRGPKSGSIAFGRVPAGGPATRMIIVIPALEPGVYEVRWTTVTPDDDGVERGTFSFTVLAPSAVPTGAATAAPGSPSRGPTAPPTAVPAASQPPDGNAGSTGGVGDLLLPLAALGLVVAVGAVWLARRR